MARGFEHREMIYFDDTFVPTVSGACVRLLTAIACFRDLDLCYFNIRQLD